VRDLIGKKDLGVPENKFSAVVKPHAVVMIKLTPTSAGIK